MNIFCFASYVPDTCFGVLVSMAEIRDFEIYPPKGSALALSRQACNNWQLGRWGRAAAAQLDWSRRGVRLGRASRAAARSLARGDGALSQLVLCLFVKELR